MRKTVRPPARLRGALDLPGDKSVSHRSLLFNAIAEGEATVTNLSLGEDVLSTVACMRAMGVGIERLGDDGSTEGTTWRVRGAGKAGLREPEDVLNAGNSGTTTRLLTGLLAGQPFMSVVTGDASLRSRPMGRIIEPLRKMGAEVYGRRGNTLAPLVVRGRRLRGAEHNLAVASAQVKSSLMLAGLYAEGETSVVSPAASRDHTERMFRAMGARVQEDGLRVTVWPATLRAVDVAVPGDISSAAFWLVAGLVHPNARVTVRNVGANPTRTGILEALEAMGARFERSHERVEGGEPVADLTVTSAALRGAEVRGAIIPRLLDEVPVLAVAACMAEGTTTIRDAAELRVKESDRIACTVAELRRLGAKVDELPDGMVIHGPARLRGTVVETHLDHRLAMSLAVAGLVAEGETAIEGAETASVSYPTFWKDLDSLMH